MLVLCTTTHIRVRLFNISALLRSCFTYGAGYPYRHCRRPVVRQRLRHRAKTLASPARHCTPLLHPLAPEVSMTSRDALPEADFP